MGARSKTHSELVLEALRRGEDGDAELFFGICRNRYLFDRSAGTWFRWGKHFWIEDRLGQALRDLEAVITLYGHEQEHQEALAIEANNRGNSKQAEHHENLAAALAKRAQQLHSLRRKQRILELAGSGSDSLAFDGQQWDTKTGRVGLPNGVLDLGSASVFFRDGEPKDYIKTVAPTPWPEEDSQIYDRADLAELAEKTNPKQWLQFLKKVFQSNDDPEASDRIVAYMQRLLGYALAGDPVEHVFVIFWGGGRNGKSTLLETFAKVLGPLVGPAQAELLLQQPRSRSSAAPSPDILALRGKRLVWATETGRGRSFDSAKVKSLTGGDTLVGRPVYGRHEVSFPSTHTLLLLTNHRPRADADDEALWLRVHLVPFTQAFVTNPRGLNQHRADPQMVAKLAAEASGILVWLAQGWLEYQRKGLDPPPEIMAATAQYREDEDLVGKFIAECCEMEPDDSGAHVQAGLIQQAFTAWCHEQGQTPLSSNKLAERLEHQFKKDTSGRHRKYFGLRLKCTVGGVSLRPVHIADDKHNDD